MNTTGQQFNQRLTAYKQAVDTEVEAWCKRFLQRVQTDFTPYSLKVSEAYCSILQRGGKRLRGVLVLNSYKMVGGQSSQMPLQAACAMELLHASLLIFDDIADRSAMRRGGPAAHVQLADTHRQEDLFGDSQHFGVSQAINAGLLGQYQAQQLLTELAVNDSVKLEATHEINRLLYITTQGQINDIYNQAAQTIHEVQLEKTLSWKTAYYTFLAPLALGAILAGANNEEKTVLEEYSLHTGIAFQIADDILGTFGDSLKSGKSAQDDIKEGKVTLLVSRALERAKPEQRKKLLDCLGNQRLTPPDHEACKQIIEDTGALRYAQQQAKKHIADAVASLNAAPASWGSAEAVFLKDLAGFVIGRYL